MVALHQLKPDYVGKVRDLYFLEDKMVMVASDRISAFDVVFNEKIEGKGRVLTQISNHWFSKIHFIKNHILETEIDRFPSPFADCSNQLTGRSVLVKKVKRIDIECVVRGYLMGSGYKEYAHKQEIQGIALPSNLTLGSKLPEPIFTPASKSDVGRDQNIPFDKVRAEVGSNLAKRLKEISLRIYSWAYAKLEQQGFLLLDSKFEFGLDENNKIILIDEVLTPDSSRFCKSSEYEEAMSKSANPPTYDKQVLRDYLETTEWNKTPPTPSLPKDVIDKTMNKYLEIEKVVKCIT